MKRNTLVSCADATPRTIPLPHKHRGAVKRIRIDKRDICSDCGSHAGLLLITLPTHTFRRPRTAAESKAIQELVDTKTLTFEHLKADAQRRKIRLCPNCIKPLQEANGVRGVNHWRRGK